jgi:hypothetical protein
MSRPACEPAGEHTAPSTSGGRPAAREANRTWEAVYGLRRLVDGDLCGRFDGQTSAGIDLDLVPDDIRAHVDATALQPGGATAALLALPDGRRIGDWVNPQPVGAEQAMGLMQFLPSTWGGEAAAAPGRPQDLTACSTPC